jgi:hypothetical protein
MVFDKTDHLLLVGRIHPEMAPEALGRTLLQAVIEPLVIAVVEPLLLQFQLQVPVNFGYEKEVREILPDAMNHLGQ